MLLSRRPAQSLAALLKSAIHGGFQQRFFFLESLPRARKVASCHFSCPGLISLTPPGYILEAFPSWKRSFYCIAMVFLPSIKILLVKLSRQAGRRRRRTESASHLTPPIPADGEKTVLHPIFAVNPLCSFLATFTRTRDTDCGKFHPGPDRNSPGKSC